MGTCFKVHKTHKTCFSHGSCRSHSDGVESLLRHEFIDDLRLSGLFQAWKKQASHYRKGLELIANSKESTTFIGLSGLEAPPTALSRYGHPGVLVGVGGAGPSLFCYDLSCPLKKTAQRNRNTSKLRENLNAWMLMMMVVVMMTIGMGFMRCLIKLENDTSWFIQATFCASPSMSTHLLRAKGCNGKCVSAIAFCKFKRYNM